MTGSSSISFKVAELCLLSVTTCVENINWKSFGRQIESIFAYLVFLCKAAMSHVIWMAV